MKYLIVMLMFTGCGQVTTKIPDEFVPYYETFQAETSVEPQNDIDFTDDLPISTNGICYRGRFISNYIRINKARWKVLSGSEREALITHELGHCTLGLDHDDTTTVGEGFKSIRKSIMSTDLLREWEFKQNRTHYYDELRGKIKK